MAEITIADLQIHLANGLGPSAFGLTNPPPCLISLTLVIGLNEDLSAANEDTMSGLDVNYSTVSKQVYALLSDPKRTFKSPLEAMRAAAAVPLAIPAVRDVCTTLELSRALLHARSVTHKVFFSSKDEMKEQEVCINALQVACVVGLHPHERTERQRLEVDIRTLPWIEGTEVKRVADGVLAFLENSSYGTLEVMVHSLSTYILSLLPASPYHTTLDLAVRKPSALPFGTPSVSLGRTISPTESTSPKRKANELESEASTSASSSTPPRIFIALGSNIGDRLSHFTNAISLLQKYGLSLVRTGRLYESEPMYVEDQDRFINSAIEVRPAAGMDAMSVLRVLKRVEREVGRVKTFTNGPRVVDLDLVYYGEEVVKIGKKGDVEDKEGVGWLEVPHWGLGEREFVLRPLADIAPDFIDPRLRVPLSTLLSRLPQTIPPQLAPLIPFPSPALPLRIQQPTPRVMAIINATPDSFSDGAASNLSIPHVLESLRQMFAAPHPPHILDIGGMSTRPNSTPCSEAEELERVVPLIRAIRSLGDSDAAIRSIPISVDTYRPQVAREAVAAGASCINDVRGGREEGMLETMAELGVPVVLMHSRGDSTSMTTAALQDYSEHGGVIGGVRSELGETVRRAEKAGVKRWNIILDPGLGFAKSHSDNLVLLRRLGELTEKGSGLEGLPVLVGGSRKGFVGRVIGREVASERGMGDAAVLAWCTTALGAKAGVEIVRVHDARAAGEVMGMTAAIRDAK